MKLFVSDSIYFVDRDERKLITVKLRNGQSFIDNVEPMEADFDLFNHIVVGQNIFVDNFAEKSFSSISINGNF